MRPGVRADRPREKLMEVPLLDLRAQFAAIEGEVRAAIDRVLETQRFILGPEVEALEAEVAEYCGCAFGIGVSSGTDALLAALMSIGVGPGHEVVTTPYTFFASAGSVARLGARPVFVDIDPRTFNIDPSSIEAVLTERTRAIVPVHLFGQMADMGPILDVARRNGLFVIEDAAQAIGAEDRGHRAGSLGHLGCFSFFPSKNLGGVGDGGLVTTNDAKLAERLRLFRNHGFQPKYHNKVVGGNFRLDALQAAVLRVKLRYLDGWTEARRANASTYRRLFREAQMTADSAALNCMSQGCRRRGDCNLEQGGPLVELPWEAPGKRHIYNQFVIRVRNRDGLVSHLKSKRIGCEIYYPVPMHLQECFRHLGHEKGDFPASECAASCSLSLPVYPELSQAMLETVVGSVREFLTVSGPGAP